MGKTYNLFIIVTGSAIVLFSLFNFAHAGNGTDLLRDCQNAEAMMDKTLRDVPTEQMLQVMLNSGKCIGLVAGVRDTMFYYDVVLLALKAQIPEKMKTCWPEKYPSVDQSVRIVLKYLRDHPGQLHEDIHFLIIQAFNNAFQCK